MQIGMEDNKAVNMEGCQQCALFVWRHKPNKLFFSSFGSCWNNLLDKFAFVGFWIDFSIISLRIDEWWISSQNHNLANKKIVVVQSTNSISSRGQKTSFWAWTLAILVLMVLSWWSMAERVFLLAICNRNSFDFFMIPHKLFPTVLLMVQSCRVALDLEQWKLYNTDNHCLFCK